MVHQPGYARLQRHWLSSDSLQLNDFSIHMISLSPVPTMSSHVLTRCSSIFPRLMSSLFQGWRVNRVPGCFD